MKGWGRAIVSRGILVLFGISLALLLGELGARLLTPNEPAVLARPQPPAGLPRIVFAPQLWEPNVKGIYEGALYRTNSEGIRGPEYTLEPAPGVFRIVIVGDSITMGLGVAEEDAYPAVLERMLNAAAAASGRRYEVLNLGIAGFNIHHDAQRLEDLGLRFHPDLVVYGCTLNDIEVDGSYRYSSRGDVGRAYYDYTQAFAQSRSALLRLLWPRYVSLREIFLPPAGSYAYELHDNYFDNEQAWLTFAMGLQRFARIQNDDGICVTVFVHTMLHYLNALHPYRSYYRKIERAANLQELVAIQSWPRFQGQAEEELVLGPYESHPNERGHELLAQALFDGLQALPAACWQGARPRGAD